MYLCRNCKRGAERWGREGEGGRRGGSASEEEPAQAAGRRQAGGSAHLEQEAQACPWQDAAVGYTLFFVRVPAVAALLVSGVCVCVCVRMRVSVRVVVVAGGM